MAAVLVIPIKKLDEAKQRLKGVLPKEKRMEVCLFLLRRFLSEAGRCPFFDQICIISPQKDLMRYLTDFPQVRHICSQADRGLNEAAGEASRILSAEKVDTMVFLHGDLPYVTAQDLEALCREAKKSRVILIPDRKGLGTTGVVLTPPDCFATCFGPDSFKRHKRRCEEEGLSWRVFLNDRLGSDLDLPEDWEKFQEQYGFDR